MAARGGAGQGPGVMVGGGGSWLGNGYLSLGFLSKSEEKWVPSWWARFRVSLKSFVWGMVWGKVLKPSGFKTWLPCASCDPGPVF